MITPRQTRLVRVPDLHVFRRTIPALCAQGPANTPCAVVVPTRGAGELMSRRQVRLKADAPSDFGGASETGGVSAFRRTFLTRDQLYDDLHARLPHPPPRLSARGLLRV